MSTVAAVVLGRERRMVRQLQMAGATSAEHARTLEELGISRGLVLRRLRERAVIRGAGGDRYYLDEPSWEAVRRSRRRAIHVAWVIALVLLMALLFSRRAFANCQFPTPKFPTPNSQGIPLEVGSWELQVGSWRLGVGS
jgi:hypothetical protein